MPGRCYSFSGPMEPLALFRRIVVWRWTPCVAPVMGSVLIALLTLALVPDEIGGMSSGTGPLALRAKRDTSSDTPADGSGAESSPASDGTEPPRHPGSGRPRMPADNVQGFFHKAQELPIEPVDPNPQPPPAEPPPPAPTATVYTLPEPTIAAAPPEPGVLPPPNVPLQPLGPTEK